MRPQPTPVRDFATFASCVTSSFYARASLFMAMTIFGRRWNYFQMKNMFYSGILDSTVFKEKGLLCKDWQCSRGHEMFHDDMIMYVIINDQQSFMATINISSAWSTLIIAMNRWEFMHIWTMIIHTCMNSHLFIAMINVDHTDDVLIVAMKDNWSCMKTLFIASYHEP